MEIFNKIFKSVKSIKRFLFEESQVIKDRDPAIKTDSEVLLYPSFRAMVYYRIAHKLYTMGHFFLARMLSQIAAHRTGIEIHPGAKIGKNLFIDHGSGVIIGETTVIGDNVTIYQGVTLGGTGKEKGKRHPTIGNDVLIGAGSRVLGPLHVGDNSKIGAGSVVIKDVPSHSTVVGVPGRVVKRNDERVPQEELDQITLPDPVMQDIVELRKDLDDLQRKVNK